MRDSNSKEPLFSVTGSELLRRIENNMIDMICIHDPQGIYKYVTPSVTVRLGYSPEELIGTSPYQYFHPDDIEHIKKEHVRVLTGMADESRIEYRHRKKDGSYTWLQTQTSSVQDTNGSVIEFLTVSRDISERKKAEQALQDIEESYEQVFLSSPAVRIIIDPLTGNIFAANQAAVDFYGYRTQELCAMTIFKINIASPAEILNCMSKVSMVYRKSIPFKHRLKDGTLRDVEIYSGPIRIKNKVFLNSVIIDVTAHMRAEEDLRESRERLALVVQGAKAGIWDWDMRSNQIFHDKRWKAIIGYGEDEISGDNIWRSRWHPEDADKIKGAMEDYLAGKTEKYEIEYRLRHKDGTYRWVLSNGKITRDQDGEPIRWTGCNIDITDQKRTKKLYLESERRLREFAEALPNASLIIDEDGRYLEVFGDEKMFHIPKKDFIGKRLHQVLPEEPANFILNEVQQAIASGKPRMGICEMQLGMGQQYFSGRTIPLSYKVGGKKTVAIVASDITEQYRTERMLQMTYELRRRSDLINDFINEKATNNESFSYLSSKLGLDSNVPLFVCNFFSDKFNFKSGDSQNDSISGVQKFKDKMINSLRDIPNCVAWDCREGIGVICQAAFEAKEWKQSEKMAVLIRNKLLEYDSSIVVSIGISDILTGIQGLKKLCRQALSAGIAARCQVIDGAHIVHYREAGIFQFIPELFGGEALKEYIERNIGDLLAYDRARQTNYLATLEELLRGSSVRETADKLFLHPKTIVFRQKRIGKILNTDLSVYQTRLALAIAIQLHKLNNV